MAHACILLTKKNGIEKRQFLNNRRPICRTRHGFTFLTGSDYRETGIHLSQQPATINSELTPYLLLRRQWIKFGQSS
jgi:hypothetical protein